MKQVSERIGQIRRVDWEKWSIGSVVVITSALALFLVSGHVFETLWPPAGEPGVAQRLAPVGHVNLAVPTPAPATPPAQPALGGQEPAPTETAGPVPSAPQDVSQPAAASADVASDETDTPAGSAEQEPESAAPAASTETDSATTVGSTQAPDAVPVAATETPAATASTEKSRILSEDEAEDAADDAVLDAQDGVADQSTPQPAAAMGAARPYPFYYSWPAPYPQPPYGGAPNVAPPAYTMPPYPPQPIIPDPRYAPR